MVRLVALAVVTTLALGLGRSAHADTPAETARSAAPKAPAAKAPPTATAPVRAAPVKAAPVTRSPTAESPRAARTMPAEAPRRTDRPGDQKRERPFVDRDGDGLNDGAESRFRFHGRERGGKQGGGPPRGGDQGREGGDRPGGRRGR